MEFEPKINSKVWAFHSDLDYPRSASVFHVKDLGNVELTDVDIEGWRENRFDGRVVLIYTQTNSGRRWRFFRYDFPMP